MTATRTIHAESLMPTSVVKLPCGYKSPRTLASLLPDAQMVQAWHLEWPGGKMHHRATSASFFAPRGEIAAPLPE